MYDLTEYISKYYLSPLVHNWHYCYSNIANKESEAQRHREVKPLTDTQREMGGWG